MKKIYAAMQRLNDVAAIVIVVGVSDKHMALSRMLSHKQANLHIFYSRVSPAHFFLLLAYFICKIYALHIILIVTYV